MSQSEPVPIWVPSDEVVASSRIEHYRQWLAKHLDVQLSSYAELHAWSVSEADAFWRSVWDYFQVPASSGPSAALASEEMPGARWFPGARLNYVDQVLRHERPEQPAILDLGEDDVSPLRAISWAELRRQVAAVAQTMRALGVGRGDRVVGYLPNIPETVIAFLATVSIGAVWSSCGQDYPAHAAAERLGQLRPRLLVTADGYRHGGRDHDRREAVAELRSAIPTLGATILVSRLGNGDLDQPESMSWEDASAGEQELRSEQVPFDHPLWVLFSSGTTGRPKGIVHGHGGVVLEHLKALAFHFDVGPTDVYWWYTSPSWMMWNFQVGGLLCGATIVCYDGSPMYPGPDMLWSRAGRASVTVLGTSPAFIQASEKAGVHPTLEGDLSPLRSVGVTGSVVPPAAFEWVRREFAGHLPLLSITGGTDVVSAFAGASPTVPIWSGEISVPCLGVALQAWDPAGRPVVDEVGELVVIAPIPSMPIYFWDDTDGARYRGAYFETYPGVWRHGDWVTITGRGTILMHGRSDSTLNRNGIRMGSADIYQAIEQMPEILDSLVLGIEEPDGRYWMPLFVVLAGAAPLTPELTDRLRTAIRERASSRHVPDDILAVPAVPRTRTGKKLEIPVKRILQGARLLDVIDPEAVDDSEALAFYVELARRRLRPDEAHPQEPG